MQKKFLPSYLLIFAALFILMSLSRPTTEKIRGHAIAFVAPLWEKMMFFRFSPFSLENMKEEGKILLSPEENLEKLQLENVLLTNELLFAKRLLEDKKALDLLIQALPPTNVQPIAPHYQKYTEKMKGYVDIKMQALPARVIFRSLDMWNNFLWINVGEADNQAKQIKIVDKYSPVVSGNSVIGIIDYVGKHQSRVCLITNPRLVPSVRIARGGEQDMLVSEYIEFLLEIFNRKKDVLIAETDRQALLQLLSKIKSTLQPTKYSWYLAKGELQGSIRPSGRVSGRTLKGTGFNYDFGDEEGESRDLRTGKLTHQPQSSTTPILKVNDLLVTTGMDGVFPPNLKVATVTKVALLKEGDYFYEIEARPTAKSLNEISLVFVLSPLSYDKNELSSKELKN